jgi:uncharacterized integral membrane protein
MNAKLLLKMLLLLAILLLLVMMGMHNPQKIALILPPVLSKPQELPAAFMYFGFFAVGLLAGTVLTARTKGSGGSRGKNDK